MVLGMPGVYGAFDRIREPAAGHDPRVLERFALLRPSVAVISE